jgi:uncharacterized membrane protein YcaP (DUF421 family)
MRGLPHSFQHDTHGFGVASRLALAVLRIIFAIFVAAALIDFIAGDKTTSPVTVIGRVGTWIIAAAREVFNEGVAHWPVVIGIIVIMVLLRICSHLHAFECHLHDMDDHR